LQKVFFKIEFYFVFSNGFFRSILFCIFKILFVSILPLTVNYSVLESLFNYLM
jgi:hypothetical protein